MKQLIIPDVLRCAPLGNLISSVKYFPFVSRGQLLGAIRAHISRSQFLTLRYSLAIFILVFWLEILVSGGGGWSLVQCTHNCRYKHVNLSLLIYFTASHRSQRRPARPVGDHRAFFTDFILF